MSTFCVTGDKKNVDDAVRILKRLIAEGNAEMLAASSHASGGDGSFANGDVNGRGRTGEQRNPGSASSRGWREMGHRIFQDGHDLSRQDGSPPTAPCRSVRVFGGLVDGLSYCVFCDRGSISTQGKPWSNPWTFENFCAARSGKS